tara:strand:- start:17 stop:259 length:243 start_codon:yes stop_codon:yes gene_type:complete
MFRSLSRFAWCLPALGPSLLYVPLAGLCAWAAVAAGWHSPGLVFYSALAVFFAAAVVQEWRAAIRLRALMARQTARQTAG